MARGKLMNSLCRLFCLRCYGGENLPSDPPTFPCDAHFGATGSCTCGLDTLRDGSVDFYKFEEELRALLKFPEQSDPDLVGKEKGIATDSIQEKEESSEFVGAARIFSADELWEAVNFFKPRRELGAGGYGSVYLGKLKDGYMVAVKKLNVIDCVERSKFREEIDNFCNLRHPNLVTLYGCTSGFEDLLFVYEYVTNGNVAKHIHEHGEAGSKVLTWDLRIRIAIETAEALSFLHFQPGRPPIIHCDIKTDNILLDDNFHVKVCDFGLSSKCYSSDRGTLGYLDPEFDEKDPKKHPLTAESDVYSFGVVLLELISGKKAVDVDRDEIYLVSLALDMITNNKLEQLVDRNIGYQSDPEIRRMINLVADLACSCLCSEGNKRPSMQEVVWKLKRITGNKDHELEHIGYSSPDEDPTYEFRNRMQEVVWKLKRIRDNKDHGIEHIGYSSRDEDPTHDPETWRMINLVADLGCSYLRSAGNKRPSMQDVDISNILQLFRHEAISCFTDLNNSISNDVHLGRHSPDYADGFRELRNLCHKLSTVVLFYCFSNPVIHEPSCSCRLYLQDNRILDGLASSTCFVSAVGNYTLILGHLNEIPIQVAQRIITKCMTTLVKEWLWNAFGPLTQ